MDWRQQRGFETDLDPMLSFPALGSGAGYVVKMATVIGRVEATGIELDAGLHAKAQRWHYDSDKKLPLHNAWAPWHTELERETGASFVTPHEVNLLCGIHSSATCRWIANR